MTFSEFIHTVSLEFPATARNLRKHRTKSGWAITSGEYENRIIAKGDSLNEAIDNALKSLGL